MITNYNTYIKEDFNKIYTKAYTYKFCDICKNIISNSLNNFKLRYNNSETPNYISLYQNNNEKFSIYIYYKSNSNEDTIILKSLTYKTQFELSHNEFDNIPNILETLIKHELTRLDNKFYNFINSIINFRLNFKHDDVVKYFNDHESDFLVSKKNQSELDEIFEEYIFKDKIFILFFNYCSKNIQDKYQHLQDANKFDLI